jgi:hypothetical protein
MEVVMGLVLGAGALLLAKRGRKAVASTIGWTARKSGWVAGRVRSSLHEATQIARDQYERGRLDAARGRAPSMANTTTNGASHSGAVEPSPAVIEQTSANAS